MNLEEESPLYGDPFQDHNHDTHSIAPSDTTNGYASTVAPEVVLDRDVNEQHWGRESFKPSKIPNQQAIAAATEARSKLSKKEAQKLDEKLSSFICGKLPRMTVTTAMPKLQKSTGFLVGTPDEIASILAAGADVHLGVHEGSKTNQDALWYEIANKKRAEVADTLLQYGARIDASKLIGCSYYSSSKDILKVLLEYGADTNGWAHLGIGPLCTAAQYGNPAGCRLLMAYGADPNAMNVRSIKGTALATACHKLNVDCVRRAIDTVKRMSQANANNGRDRMLPILQDLKVAGATDPEIDVYVDPYSEATKSLIHPWDYGKHLKRLRMGSVTEVGRGRGQSSGLSSRATGGLESHRDSVVTSEYGESTRGLLVK